jgi:hypothetical protein
MEKNFLESDKTSFHRGELSLIEHLFIGGSEIVDGELWSTEKILNFLRQTKTKNEIENKLLKPLDLLKNGGKTEYVNEKRQQKLRGAFLLFDSDRQAEMNFNNKGVEQYIELEKAGENGKINGIWRIGLIDQDNKEIDSSGLRIERSFRKYFSLLEDKDSKGMILKLKLSSKK